MKVKGNISIMILFILIASSLMGLLSMYFIRQLYSYSGLMHDYYKGYYISKAGIELGLVGIDANPIGLNMNVASRSALNSNFECSEESWNCYFESRVVGKSDFLNTKHWVKSENCTNGNALSLGTGEQLIIPLYTVKSGSNYNDVIDGLAYDRSVLTNIRNSKDRFSFDLFGSYTKSKINLGIIATVLDKGEYVNDDFGYMFKQVNLGEDSIKILFNEYLGSDDVKDNFNTDGYLHYLLIANPNKEEISFCIRVNGTTQGKKYYLPTSTYYLESVGYYREDTIGLNAIRKPGFLNF